MSNSPNQPCIHGDGKLSAEERCADDIVAIEKEFRREHPWIARGQALLMHWPWPATDVQLKTMSEHMRAVTFSPAP